MTTIYSTPTCHYCEKAKEWMRANGVKFKEVDVKADLVARKEMIELSGQMGVPVTVTDKGDVLTGFDEYQFKTFFGK